MIILTVVQLLFIFPQKNKVTNISYVATKIATLYSANYLGFAVAVA